MVSLPAAAKSNLITQSLTTPTPQPQPTPIPLGVNFFGLSAVATAVIGIVWWRDRRQQRRSQQKVVILGGGFAGLTCAVELNSRGIPVDLIDEKQYFEYTPNVIARLAGREDHSLGRSYEEIFLSSWASRSGRWKLCARRFVCSRHPSAATWKILSDESIAAIVVATGKRYPFPIGCLEDTNIGRNLDEREEELRSIANRFDDSSSILIIGAGIVGVELAAELAQKYRNLPKLSKRIILAGTGGDVLGSSFSEQVREYIRRRLTGLHVEMHLDERLVEVEVVSRCGKATFVGSMSGIRFNVDAHVYCTGGQRDWSKTVNDIANNTQIDTYVIGDISPKPKSQQLASYAHWEAEALAHWLTQVIDRPDDPAKGVGRLRFTQPPEVTLISLGPSDGVLAYDGRLVFGGWLVPKMKQLIAFWLLAQLPLPYTANKYLPRMCKDSNPYIHRDIVAFRTT